MDTDGELSQDIRHKDLRSPPKYITFDEKVHQRLHWPQPAVKSPDEKAYEGVLEEFGLLDPSLPLDHDGKTKNAKKRASRFGFSGLFGKSKPSEAGATEEKMSPHLEVDESSAASTAKDNEIMPGNHSILDSIDGAPPVEPHASQLQNKYSKSTLRAKASFKKEANVQSATTWDPPPLFQVYPQSVKHATLLVPNLSAEAIVRLNANQHPSADLSNEAYTFGSHSQKSQKEKKLKKHTGAEVLLKSHWSHQTYVLTTSGYLLQYAGQGSFDRLPEKILPLTNESAAFASDAIPGHPYVLQVSQVSDELGTLDKEASRSMLKKVGLRGGMRRSTSTFLLVLNTPEELNTWLVAVRKEIQAAGGKEYHPDTYPISNDDQPEPELRQRPSQRYLVVRDPHKFSEKPQQCSQRIHSSDNDQFRGAVGGKATRSTQAAVESLPSATQVSTRSPSSSTAASSVNQVNLDSLKETPRESYASTCTKTTATSRGSSPEHPPMNITEAPAPSLAGFQNRPSPSMHARTAQSSMQEPSGRGRTHTESLRPFMGNSSPQQSAIGMPQHGGTISPTTPNFSVPTFSKRYSMSKSPSASISKESSRQAYPASVPYKPPSPPMIEEEGASPVNRISTLGELQQFRRPAASNRKGVFANESDAFLTPPHSSGSCERPSSSHSEQRTSRRFSSLEHLRSTSPVTRVRLSPSPHPPPTAPLPPIPSAKSAIRSSSITPPTAVLSPTPKAGKSPRRRSMMPVQKPAMQMDLPTVPIREPLFLPSSLLPSPKSPSVVAERGRPSHTSSADPSAENLQDAGKEGAPNCALPIPKPAQGFAVSEPKEVRKLRRPCSMQVPRAIPLGQPNSRLETNGGLKVEGLTVPFHESPPKPSREPPHPPSQHDYRQCRKGSTRVGREPPPVYSPATSPRSRISVSARAESYFDSAAPHPFIPPIRVSERKFRGSLDGPWNTPCDAPQRIYRDLSTG